jgi:endonuclease/exonuclease/phosphatase family metal-dependent hydrolase
MNLKISLFTLLLIIASCSNDSPEENSEKKNIYDHIIEGVSIENTETNITVVWDSNETNPNVKIQVIYTDYTKKQQIKEEKIAGKEGIDISNIYPLTSNIEVKITDGNTTGKSRTISVTPILWSLKVASFNIRTDSDTGINAWNVRKQRVYSIINKYGFDICGIQETTVSQALDMKRDLTDYDVYGVGRISGIEGEMVQIIYKKDRFTVLDKGYFWLSETPDIPSLGWGANLHRICSWLKLKDNKNQKEFYFYSTHLHHTADANENRLESVKLIVSRMKQETGETPAICVGDFNTTPTTDPIIEMKKTYSFAKEVSLTTPIGPDYTYNGFKTTTSDKWLDYIFISSEIGVKTFSVVDELVNGEFPSDHFPVLSEVIIYKSPL